MSDFFLLFFHFFFFGRYFLVCIYFQFILILLNFFVSLFFQLFNFRQSAHYFPCHDFFVAFFFVLTFSLFFCIARFLLSILQQLFLSLVFSGTQIAIYFWQLISICNEFFLHQIFVATFCYFFLC